MSYDILEEELEEPCFELVDLPSGGTVKLIITPLAAVCQKTSWKLKKNSKINMNKWPRKIIVKTLTAAKRVDKVFDFFSNMKNMETGGAIESMKKSDDGWWTFEHSIAGKSKMKHKLSHEFGIIDHGFIGGGLEWNVFVRVIPNQSGSTISWIFMRPNGLNDDQFEDQLKMFDVEIDQWKIVLENM